MVSLGSEAREKSSRCVSERRMQINPSKMRRKQSDIVKTRVGIYLWEKFARKPEIGRQPIAPMINRLATQAIDG